MEVGIVYSGKSGFSSDMVDSSSETMSSRESSANKGTVVKGTAVFRGVLGISISSVSSRIEATSSFLVGPESEVISEVISEADDWLYEVFEDTATVSKFWIVESAVFSKRYRLRSVSSLLM